MVAGHKTSGEPVFEQVLVDLLDDGTYRIIATPGLVLGVAADDVVRVTPDASATRSSSAAGTSPSRSTATTTPSTR